MSDIRKKKIHLQITDRCNMKCRHCYVGDAGKQDLPRKVIDKVFNALESKELDFLGFSGGEVLLVPSILHYILDKIEEDGIKVKQFGFPTNGTHLLENVDLIRRMHKISKNKIALSISVTKYHKENKNFPDIPLLESKLPKDLINWELIDDDHIELISVGRAKQLTDNEFDYTKVEDSVLFVGVDGYTYLDAFFFGDKTKRLERII